MRHNARKSTPLWSVPLLAALLTNVRATPTRIELESASLDESGVSVGSGRLQLLTSEGQALIGAVKSGITSLEMGFLYTLRGGKDGDKALIARLTFPRGECAIPDSRPIKIIATVSGSSVKTWTLETAPGRHAETGFQSLAAGTREATDTDLAVWNTAGLSGWHTLRLTVVDGSKNSVVSLGNVFFGDPTNAFSSGPVKLAWPDVAKHLVQPCD